MAMNQSQLLDFISLHRFAVEASCNANGAPEAALVGFVANAKLELFFDCFDTARKAANLRRDGRIAFVIGGQEIGDERTVQYEGVVDQPEGAELEQLQRNYFAVHPAGVQRSKLPGILYFRARPRWICYSNYNVRPAEALVFAGADLAIVTGEEPPVCADARRYAQTKGPWQPRIERTPEFNPFQNAREQGGEPPSIEAVLVPVDE